MPDTNRSGRQNFRSFTKYSKPGTNYTRFSRIYAFRKRTSISCRQSKGLPSSGSGMPRWEAAMHHPQEVLYRQALLRIHPEDHREWAEWGVMQEAIRFQSPKIRHCKACRGIRWGLLPVVHLWLIFIVYKLRPVIL